MEDISSLFTRTNLKIIEILLKERLHIREIAQRLDCSPAKVHAAVQTFKENNLIREIKEKNKVIISLNQDSPLVKKIKPLLNIKSESENKRKESVKLFDTISPLDFRYCSSPKIFEKIQPYLTEEGFIKYAARVESALARVLYEKKVCSKKISDEIAAASKATTAFEVYEEEDRIKHNMRALANIIRNKVSEEAKPFVHFTTTSYDIIATADAARYKDFTNNILVPELLKFEKTLTKLAFRERKTVQIGRTHGQFASPVTFGLAIAHYVSRLGRRIKAIKRTGNNLRGKISGAVGAYNATSLFIKNVEEFERVLLAKLNLLPSPTSTQVAEPEFLVDFLNSIVSCFGVLANLSDDMRHLQRSEISEVGEFFDSKQVGSSTMPQKRNPINFENVKGMWKEFMPRMTTMYMDQISEHQRDLTNSASMRFIPELLAGFYVSIIRLNKVMSNLSVAQDNIKANFEKGKNSIIAEPLYIILAGLGHEDAHEIVRTLTLESQQSGKTLLQLAKQESSLKPFLAKMTPNQLTILNQPESYTGIAAEKTKKICEFWRKELKL
tara:strand:- start:30503 stop:32164 length:1662 start_codon:yes stop_codon:yes gene_type:complete